MISQHRTLWLAKDVASPDSYQDAFAVGPTGTVAAIADGVSSTLFSGSWARILTAAVVADPPDVVDDALLGFWLDACRQMWSEPIDPQSLAWHQKPKFEQGAGATLLWLTFVPGTLQMRVFAIGDCCLFHVRAGMVQRAFPLEDSRLFDTDPDVLRSVGSPEDARLNFQTLDDQCQPDDLLVLCSDALAQWALIQLESGSQPNFDAFWQMPVEQWQQQIESLRQQQGIRYDDTTVTLLRVGHSMPADEQPAASEGILGEMKKLLPDW